MFIDSIPDCVPEHYRGLQEDADHEYDLKMQRRSHFLANRAKLDAALVAGLSVLTLRGPGPCWTCQDADHDTMTADDDDFDRVICHNPACPQHQKEESQ